MIQVADYIVKKLTDYGVSHVFMVAGGPTVFLNSAFAREKRIKYICNHNEQACAMSAEAYSRVTGKIGVINVTVGPGAINAINGVFGAWTDSIPMLVISGQVKRETCMATYKLSGLRQLGHQEADIIRMVHDITKYAVLVDESQSIRFHLEKAIFLATSGRPGPCWLDIPIDVQSSKVDELTLQAYDPKEELPHWDLKLLSRQCHEIISRLQTSSHPVIIVGSGIRLARAEDIFHIVIKKLGIPVTTALTGTDLIETDDPLFCGRPGTLGDRAGNFTVQNSDTLLIIGSSLNIRQVSYDWKSFAKHAYKIQVDVDEAELNKPTVRPDMAVHCDARIFLEEINRQLDLNGYDASRHEEWLTWCRERVGKYPVVLKRHRSKRKPVNPYHFIYTLFKRLANDDVIVCGTASAFAITTQVAYIKKGQRLFFNSGSNSMGYDLPAAIGAAVAREGKRVICFAGDGSIQFNIQELQTIAHHQLAIKIFVLNNGGYLFIRKTQLKIIGHQVGESPESGVSFPDITKIGKAYGITSFRIKRHNFASLIDKALETPGPVICEVILDPEQPIEPKASSKLLPDGRIVSAPLEDMEPFLEREDLLSNIIIQTNIKKQFNGTQFLNKSKLKSIF